MIASIRERLTLVLVALLPFHALLVTVFTKLIAGSGHAPLSWLALWKEGVLGVILGLALVKIVASSRQAASGKRQIVSFDNIDFLIVALALLSLPVTAVGHGDWKLFLFGFKYDFVSLLAFLLLRRAEWSVWFGERLRQVIVCSGLAAATYGIVSFFLPAVFFQWLGYSDLHSIYMPGGPLPAFQHIEGLGLRRIQGAFSGPNQFGIWLLLPWSVLLVSFLKRFKPARLIARTILTKLHLVRAVVPWWTIGGIFLVAAAIILTFSRAAWLAAFVVTLLGVWRLIPFKAARKIMLGVLGAGALIGIMLILLAPSVMVRLSSSQGHVARPIEAAKAMVREPFGYGLGAAGPASNRVSDACVYLEEGDDPSWASDRPDLCVFVGAKQVQPIERVCHCPFLPENWYLQIGVELGIAGLILFLLLIIGMLKGLLSYPDVFLPFLGISIAAIFLHAWEDSAVAYTAWVFAATVLSVPTRGAR